MDFVYDLFLPQLSRTIEGDPLWDSSGLENRWDIRSLGFQCYVTSLDLGLDEFYMHIAFFCHG